MWIKCVPVNRLVGRFLFNKKYYGVIYILQLLHWNAVNELNKIRTKQPTADPFGVGAGLPAYSGALTQAAILTEIYRNRCIELYMQGFKMEDMRRFARSNTPNVEKRRNFFPYPFRERDNNKNTPATDPTF